MPSYGICIALFISLMAKRDTVEYALQESAEFQTVGFDLWEMYDSVNELPMSEDIRAKVDLIFSRATDIVEKHAMHFEKLVLEYECMQNPEVEDKVTESDFEVTSDEGERERLVDESDFAELRELLEGDKTWKRNYETEVAHYKANYMSLIVNLLPRLKRCLTDLRAIQITLATSNFTIHLI